MKETQGSGIFFLDKTPETELNPLKRWTYPLGLYAQALSCLPEIDDPNVRSKLSWEIDKYWRERGTTNSLLTIKLLGKCFRLVTDKYPGLDVPGEVKLGKQQPSLIESMEATVLRLEFLRDYVSQIDPAISSVVSGGSMSYGRFYNVREGEDPSDLDLMVVYEDNSELLLDARMLMPENLGFAREDQELLEQRIRYFSELVSKNEADILSQKAETSNGFGVSMHMMSKEVFAKMMAYDPHYDIRNGGDVLRRVRDYKPEPFKHQHVRLNDFNGEPRYFSVDEKALSNGIKPSEVITQIPAHAIESGMYIPGLYHNLASPRYEMEGLSARECVAAVTLFWDTMRKLEKEYRKSNPEASALKSHIRSDIFNPELVKHHEQNNRLF